MGGKNLFNKFWDNWIYTYKSIKLDSHLKLYTNINSKWIRSLNIIAIRLLKENTGINLYDFRLGSRVLDTTPKQQKKKNKLDFIKMKNVGTTKDIIKKEKTIYRMGENIYNS